MQEAESILYVAKLFSAATKELGQAVGQWPYELNRHQAGKVIVVAQPITSVN